MEEDETTFTTASEADLFADSEDERGLTHGRPSRKMRGLGESLSRSLRRRTSTVAPQQEDELFTNNYGTFHPGSSEMSRLSSGDEQVITVESHRVQHRRSFGKQMKLRYLRLRDQVNDALTFFGVSKAMECYGGGVYSYLSFVLWLARINLLTVFLYLGAVILPYAIIKPGSDFNSTIPKNLTFEDKKRFDYVVRCSQQYEANLTSYINSRKASPVEFLQDILQGSGPMEKFKFLFIGQYFDKVIYRPLNIDFNTSLGLYLCLWLTLFFVLFVILLSSGRGMLERLTAHSDAKYTFKVLSRWDFILRDRRRAKVEKTNIANELKHQVEEDERMRKKQRMTPQQRRRLMGKRAGVWLGYIVMSVTSLVGIYFVLIKSQEETARLKSEKEPSNILLFVFQYLPSVYIVVTNFIIEQYCNIFVKFEEYGANTQISITIKRTIFLRFVSVVVLMASMFQQLNSCNIPAAENEFTSCTKKGTGINCDDLRCWETYVGQQIYKLVFLDIILFLGICLLDLLRKFVCRFIKYDVSTEFNISMNVIDIIYTQTLGWLGMFFCPLLPIVVFIKIIAIYYFKKLCIRYNIYRHNQNSFNAEQTESNFLWTLVIVLIFIVILPLGAATSLFAPSRSCSPYRLYFPEGITDAPGARNALDNALQIAFERLGTDVQRVITTLDSYVVMVLIWIILILIIYYFITLSKARDDLNKHLELQMVNEMQDQAFQQKRALESLKALRIAQAAQRRHT